MSSLSRAPITIAVFVKVPPPRCLSGHRAGGKVGRNVTFLIARVQPGLGTGEKNSEQGQGRGVCGEVWQGAAGSHGQGGQCGVGSVPSQPARARVQAGMGAGHPSVSGQAKIPWGLHRNAAGD